MIGFDSGLPARHFTANPGYVSLHAARVRTVGEVDDIVMVAGINAGPLDFSGYFEANTNSILDLGHDPSRWPKVDPSKGYTEPVFFHDSFSMDNNRSLTGDIRVWNRARALDVERNVFWVYSTNHAVVRIENKAMDALLPMKFSQNAYAEGHLVTFSDGTSIDAPQNSETFVNMLTTWYDKGSHGTAPLLTLGGTNSVTVRGVVPKSGSVLLDLGRGQVGGAGRVCALLDKLPGFARSDGSVCASGGSRVGGPRRGGGAARGKGFPAGSCHRGVGSGGGQAG